jgi:hypothetical protein
LPSPPTVPVPVLALALLASTTCWNCLWSTAICSILACRRSRWRRQLG